jgi:hypothetical protein
MSQVVETHIRKRGFFGWVFISLFRALNALMALWAWLALSATHDQYVRSSSPAFHAGTAIGGVMVSAVLLFLWVAGAVILGLLALLTLGQKTVIVRSVA